jgi:hypothetical protein
MKSTGAWQTTGNASVFLQPALELEGRSVRLTRGAAALTRSAVPLIRSALPLTRGAVAITRGREAITRGAPPRLPSAWTTLARSR